MTKVFILVSIILILLYDLIVYLLFGDNYTISATIRVWDEEHPVIEIIYVCISVFFYWHFFVQR